MKWTKEMVLKKLNEAPVFRDLTNEWKGAFHICYPILDNTLILSNSVRGISEVFLVFPINQETISDVCDFAEIARGILKEQIKRYEL